MEIVSVAVPGPWWTDLSYTHGYPLPPGIRVRIPLGASSRVGLTAVAEEPENSVRPDDIKEIIDVIDRLPPLPDELWRTICWFAKTWFIGKGMAAKALLPVPFLAGEPLEEVCPGPRTGSSSVRYVYEPRDSDRMAVYRDILTA